MLFWPEPPSDALVFRFFIMFFYLNRILLTLTHFLKLSNIDQNSKPFAVLAAQRHGTHARSDTFLTRLTHTHTHQHKHTHSITTINGLTPQELPGHSDMLLPRTCTDLWSLGREETSCMQTEGRITDSMDAHILIHLIRSSLLLWTSME